MCFALTLKLKFSTKHACPLFGTIQEERLTPLLKIIAY